LLSDATGVRDAVGEARGIVSELQALIARLDGTSAQSSH
jgi:hypothetical protein